MQIYWLHWSAKKMGEVEPDGSVRSRRTLRDKTKEISFMLKIIGGFEIYRF